MVEWYWQGKTRVLGGKPLPVSVGPPQILNGAAWNWTRFAGLTTWAMARPTTLYSPDIAQCVCCTHDVLHTAKCLSAVHTMSCTQHSVCLLYTRCPAHSTQLSVCLLYTRCPAHSTQLSVCLLYTRCPAHSTQLSVCLLYTPCPAHSSVSVCCTHDVLHTAHSSLSVCCTHDVLHTAHSSVSVCCTHDVLHTAHSSNNAQCAQTHQRTFSYKNYILYTHFVINPTCLNLETDRQTDRTVWSYEKLPVIYITLTL